MVKVIDNLIFSPDEDIWYYDRYIYMGKDRLGKEYQSKESFKSKVAAQIAHRSNDITWEKM